MTDSKKRTKHLKFSTALFKGGYVYNAILTQLSGLCALAAATNIKNSLWLSLSFLVIIITNEIIASAFLKNIPRWIRICLYAIISAISLLPVYSFLGKETVASLGIYLPLMCVSGIIVTRCEKFSVRTSVINSIIDALACAVSFFVITFIIGFTREWLSFGTLFGIKIGNPFPVRAMASPLGGLILLGFLAAIQKWSVKKYFHDEITDTFSLNKVFEKPTIKDPGLEIKSQHEIFRQQRKEEEQYDKIRPRYSIEDINSKKEND